MRSRLALRTAGWVTGLTAALWMTAGGPAGAIPFPNASSSPGAGSWTVYHGDPAGTGAAAAAGRVDTASRAWTSAALDGQIYGEPLVSAGRVYVATENDSVYGFDADAVGPPLWHSTFLGNGITPVQDSQVGNCVDITPQYGITATPVIDPTTHMLYVVANTMESGVNTYRLHALDITTGGEKFGGPVLILASVKGTGVGSDANGNIVLDPTHQVQRTGLSLVNGVLYFGFASHCDIVPWHGWVLGYGASDLSRVFVYNVTPNGSEGGVWQSGGQPTFDQSGDIYVATGNGTFDVNTGGSDYGDSLVRATLSKHDFDRRLFHAL